MKTNSYDTKGWFSKLIKWNFLNHMTVHESTNAIRTLRNSR